MERCSPPGVNARPKGGRPRTAGWPRVSPWVGLPESAGLFRSVLLGESRRPPAEDAVARHDPDIAFPGVYNQNLVPALRLQKLQHQASLHRFVDIQRRGG